jgi:heme-degrading monooxygenase HmoA
MIARFWTAKIAQAHARIYTDHLRSQVLATLRKIDGYIGTKLLEREISEGVEIVVITLWQSLDAVRAFAGPDLEKAVVSDDVVSLFLQYDQRVRHYKVVVMDALQHENEE